MNDYSGLPCLDLIQRERERVCIICECTADILMSFLHSVFVFCV